MGLVDNVARFSTMPGIGKPADYEFAERMLH